MNANYPKNQMQDSEEKLVRNAMGECEIRLQDMTSHYLGEYQQNVVIFPHKISPSMEKRPMALRTLNTSGERAEKWEMGKIPGNHGRAWRAATKRHKLQVETLLEG